MECTCFPCACLFVFQVVELLSALKYLNVRLNEDCNKLPGVNRYSSVLYVPCDRLVTSPGVSYIYVSLLIILQQRL